MNAQVVEHIDRQLHQAAAAICGSADFGRGEYRPALRVLLEAFGAGDDGSLRPEVERTLTSLLVSRSYSERGWKKRPQVLQQPIEAPVFVVGLPRSGTTALHRLLAVDTQFQGLPLWLAATPMVRPARESWGAIPEFQLINQMLEQEYRRTPGLEAAHFFGAAELEECYMLHGQDFLTEWFWEFGPRDGYLDWLEGVDFRSSYQRYADNLRLIGADEPHKRWLLKDPLHLLHLDTVLEVFPDASIIFLHRDPAASMASYCNLVKMRDGARAASDPDSLGRRTCALWGRALRQGLAVRARCGARCHDVRYSAFVEDPLACVRGIYARLDIELRADVERGMREWVAQNPQGKHGIHRYDGADSGLDAELLREHFADYPQQLAV